MDEKIIIKATPKKFKVLPTVLLVISVVWLAITYMLEFEDLYWLAWAILVLFVAVAATLSLRAVELILTNKKITIYNPIFKSTIELPIDSISAISKTSVFTEGIAVATSSGKIDCIFIDNRDQIYTELNKLINQRQETASNITVVKQDASSADELKKIKDLLDSGIITQEEFDAKKKQLLGL